MAMMKTVEPSLGSIGLVQIRGRWGLVIRILQWLNGDGFADIEHALVYVGAGDVVSAFPGGARLDTLASYLEQGYEIEWIECPEQYGAAVAMWARSFVGIKYSFLDYLALALHRFHVPVPWLRAYIASSGHMICSQLADRAAKLAGWHLFADGRWDGYVTPGALRRLRARLLGLAA